MSPPGFNSLPGDLWPQLCESGCVCLLRSVRLLLPTQQLSSSLLGALCEPASPLIYLLGKEVTIAVITGRYVSESGVGLSECYRVGVAEPAPQEAAIKSLCLEWCKDSSPSVGLRPRASQAWDRGAMECVHFVTEGADNRQGSQLADTSEQHRPWLRVLQTPCCRLSDTGGASRA